MRRFVLGALLLYAVVWAAMTYPQVRHMSDGVSDAGDPLLNTWALAWVAHQLPFAPAHVFDGNIFHPERRTLAYSETLLAPAMVGAPLMWLGAGPILVYNLLLMAAFVVSGLGTAILVRDLTGSGTAGIVAGALFAFQPIRFDHYAHFQLLSTQWMPLALWGFHRFLSTQRYRWAVALGVMLGAQTLTSMYNALFFAVQLALVAGVILAVEWRQLPRRLSGLALAIALTGAMAAPVAIAHLRARAVVGERSRAAVEDGSARWTDFAAASPTNLVFGATARWAAPEHRLFPGVLGVILTAVALWPPWSMTRVAYGLALFVAIDLARGLNGWTYGPLYDNVLAFRSLRIPARMAIVAGLPLAVLAGFGAARLITWAGSTAAQRLLAVGLLGLVVLESWSGPIRLRSMPLAAPDTYSDLLADKGEASRTSIIRRASDRAPVAIVELPINKEDPTFMYYSTFHWQSLINGYSGFYSGRYVQLDDALRRFPASRSLEELAQLQARYVVVHGELLPADRYQALTSEMEASPSFQLVSKRPWQGREIALYRFSFAPAR